MEVEVQNHGYGYWAVGYHAGQELFAFGLSSAGALRRWAQLADQPERSLCPADNREQ